MAPVLRFRSMWGVDPGQGYEDWKKWFPSLKAQGYAGVEICVASQEDLPTLRGICEKNGLEITAHIYSEWRSHDGPKPGRVEPRHLLQDYRTQLENAKILRPLKINSQSGTDQWSVDQAIEFFEGTVAIDAELGLTGKVCHETHRTRCLYNPYATAHVLSKVPSLRLTADFSHFVLVCERLLDLAEEDKELLRKIIPHVHHIHARIGTTQSSQCPDPMNPLFSQERGFFENVWKQIIEASLGSNDSSTAITFVPEYGIYPYHPSGSLRDYSEVADAEGLRLQSLFEEFATSAA